MGFIACFSLPTPMSWVFTLDFSSLHPVSALELLNQLPVFVFLLEILFKNPRRGFLRLIFPLYTQFPLRNFSINFRFVLFCLQYIKSGIFGGILPICHLISRYMYPCSNYPTGKFRIIVVPFPSSLSISNVTSCRFRINAVSASPSPAPPFFRLRDLSII